MEEEDKVAQYQEESRNEKKQKHLSLLSTDATTSDSPVCRYYNPLSAPPALLILYPTIPRLSCLPMLVHPTIPRLLSLQTSSMLIYMIRCM
jgi:hypothetical protein